MTREEKGLLTGVIHNLMKEILQIISRNGREYKWLNKQKASEIYTKKSIRMAQYEL